MQPFSVTSPEMPRAIQWGAILYNQDWAFICVNVVIVIALGVVSSVNVPIDRPFLITDATISDAYNPQSTIPFYAVVLVPLISLLLSLVVGEIFIPRRTSNRSLTNAFATTLHFFLDFCFCGATTAIITEISKILVGYHRPDFLDRCQPASTIATAPEGETNTGRRRLLEDELSSPPSYQGNTNGQQVNVTFTTTPTWGLPSSNNPACTSDLAPAVIQDGMKSFPSGHASMAFSLGIYVAVYVIWAVFYKPHRRYAGSRQKQKLLSRIVLELGIAGAFLWALFQISWAWGVCLSRINDNKHHPADVAAGAVLGSLIGALFILRSIPRHYTVQLPPGYGCEDPSLLQYSTSANDDATPEI